MPALKGQQRLHQVMSVTTDFKTKLQSLMGDYNLGIQNTDGLTGDELAETTANNDGMRQLYEAITELHHQFIVAAAPAKRAPAKKKAAAGTATDSNGEEAANESAGPEKKKRAPAKKRAPKAPAADGAEKAKRALSAFSKFTSHISKMKKGEEAGGDVKVTVSLEKVTDKCEPLLATDAAKPLLAMKGHEHTIDEVLEECKKLLQAIDGKIVPFKLTGLLWSAVGNQNPFATAPPAV